MKKSLLTILILTLFFSLTGCLRTENNDFKDLNKKIENLEKQNDDLKKLLEEDTDETIIETQDAASEENDDIEKNDVVDAQNPTHKDNEIASWKTYTDKEVGFSFKYPENVKIGAISNESNNLVLNIKTTETNKLEGTMGYDKETAIVDIDALSNGEYGENIDFAFDKSKKVVKISDKYGKDFVVFGRFEVCDVAFERKLIFYKNNYQIVMTLLGPKEKIMTEAKDFFFTDSANCQDETIWDYNNNGQADFFDALNSEKDLPESNSWYNTFDDILNTIGLN